MKPVAKHRYAHIAPVDANKPIAGFYRMKLVRGGPWLAVKLWHGPPNDPETGEELDRSHRWQALLDGAEVEVWRVWPSCAVEPISESDYGFMLANSAWVKQHSPEEPAANPSQPIDLMRAPSPF